MKEKKRRNVYYFDYSLQVYEYIMTGRILRQSEKKLLKDIIEGKTVKEFAQEYPIGKYAVTMNGHITAIIDGIIIDTFNPENKIMRCAWKIN